MTEQDRAEREQVRGMITQIDLKAMYGLKALTRQELIAKDLATGYQTHGEPPQTPDFAAKAWEYLRREAIAREREACAKIAEDMGHKDVADQIRKASKARPSPLS